MDRDLIFWILFIVIATLVLTSIARHLYRRFSPVRHTHGRPWLERHDWRAGRVLWNPGSGLGRAAVNVAIAIVFAVAFVFITELDKSVIYFMIAAVAFTLITSLRNYALQRASGGASFAFDSFPFILGEHLTGTLRIERGDAITTPRLMLACFYSGTHTFHFDWDEFDPPWHVRRVVLANAERYVGNALEIDVDFELPAGQFPTVLHGMRKAFWELSVWNGGENGVPLMAFRLPVFGPDVKGLREPTAIGRGKKRALDRSLSVFSDESDVGSDG